MTVDAYNLFIATEQDIEIYNFQPLINLPIVVTNDDGSYFPFNGFVSAYMNIFSSRNGFVVKQLKAQITLNNNVLNLNASASDMTFENYGKYYYELGYLMSGGYPYVIQYGNLFVL